MVPRLPPGAPEHSSAQEHLPRGRGWAEASPQHLQLCKRGHFRDNQSQVLSEGGVRLCHKMRKSHLFPAPRGADGNGLETSQSCPSWLPTALG